MKILTVDRIEEYIAVCFDENGEMLEIGLCDLPFEIREGSVVRIDDDGTLFPDAAAEAERRKKLFSLQESLFDE